MTKYCTLAKAKTEDDITGASKTLDDNYILAAIEAVSRRIDGLLQPTKKLSKRPYFAPYIESRAVRYFDSQVNSASGVLDINQYFLELNTVLSGTVSITSTVTPWVNGFAPYRALQLSSTSGNSWYTVGCGDSDPRPYIKPLTINATWGWHGDYSNAWDNTSILNGAVLIAATTIDVSIGSGVLFSPGNLIKVNDEYMEVTSVSTDELTVTRGANGSTAAAHANADVVYIWVISEDVVRVTARQAASMYARRGAFEEAQFSDTGGVVTYPQDLLQELVNTLSVYGVDDII